jgi:DNA-binding LacI/PurR family transcriptional regulator
VSNVLNGRTNRMSNETLDRIRAAIAELGYQPNKAARFLKTGQAELIGLLVPSIANPSYGALGREVEIAAREKGYRILMGNTHRRPQYETEFLDDLRSHGARAAIVFSSLLDDSHFQPYAERGMAIISFDSRAPKDRPSLVDYVSIDNSQASWVAVDHLRQFGHRRLAFLGATGQTTSRQEKIAGFLAAVEAAGLADSAQVISGKVQSGYGDAEMAELGRSLAGQIASLDVRPTGVVTVNDMMAFGFIAGLAEHGLKVPDDISVVGMDDLFLSGLFSPALTSVGRPLTQMAHAMVDRLVARLAKLELPTREFLYPPTLVSRQSVAPPPK